MEYTVEMLNLLIEQADARRKNARKEYEEALVAHKSLKQKLLNCHIENDIERLDLVNIDYALAAHKASCLFDDYLEYEGKTFTFKMCYMALIDRLADEYRKQHGVTDGYKTALLLLYEYEDCSQFKTNFRKIDKWFYEQFREQYVKMIEEFKTQRA